MTLFTPILLVHKAVERVSIICKGVTIGDHAMTAGSVVVSDIPANCIAGGNPTKVIRRGEG